MITAGMMTMTTTTTPMFEEVEEAEHPQMLTSIMII
jgi:hypothetical protein